MTRAEHIAEAVAHERAARWSAAKKARAAAMSCPPEPGAEELRPGTVLQHVRWGKVEAECAYVAEGDWRVNGISYPHLTAATKAAADALGKGARGNPAPNRFWGLERQEQDPYGWAQTLGDADFDEDEEIELEAEACG